MNGITFNQRSGMKTKSTIDTRIKLENICDWLAEKKGLDLLAMDLAGKSNVAEGIVIAGATSARHGQGLADYVLEKAKENNYEFFHMEGYKNGLWILLDFNDVLVNIFHTDQREIYRLEDLYPGARLVRDERNHL